MHTIVILDIMDEYTAIIIVMRTTGHLYKYTLRLKDLNRYTLGRIFCACDTLGQFALKKTRRFSEFYSFCLTGASIGHEIWAKYPDPFVVFDMLRRNSELVTLRTRSDDGKLVTKVVAKVQAFLLTEEDECKRYMNDERLEGNYPQKTCCNCKTVCGNNHIEHPRRCMKYAREETK